MPQSPSCDTPMEPGPSSDGFIRERLDIGVDVRAIVLFQIVIEELRGGHGIARSPERGGIKLRRPNSPTAALSKVCAEAPFNV
jgi:hypothetical protein